MRIYFYWKLCLVFAIVSILFYYVKMMYYIVEVQKIQIKNEVEHSLAELETSNKSEKGASNLKYILQWTSPKTEPFVWMGVGQKGYIERNCEYQNCYVTSDREYLGDYTKFDAIAFEGKEVSCMQNSQFPKKRSKHQKFAFASMESADNYPVCSASMNGFFNWTWTYRLDSESRYGYMIVKDINETIIGPNREMNWIKSEDMKPVSEDMKNVFKGKSKAAAWFVSNCGTRSRREVFTKELDIELRKFNLQVDIYGTCGQHQCSRNNETACDEIIKRDYFFYLSFENSFSEDYVTEKLLRGLEYNAIPIVYGAANYSRFMPDGAYLNARELGAKKLAEKMHELMNDLDKYSEYFKWTNHYTYHRTNAIVDSDNICGLCALLHNEDKVKETSVYERFRKWWNPPGRCVRRHNDPLHDLCPRYK